MPRFTDRYVASLEAQGTERFEVKDDACKGLAGERGKRRRGDAWLDLRERSQLSPDLPCWAILHALSATASAFAGVVRRASSTSVEPVQR
ncbi:hypothetical protein CO683_39055 [Bradyrhizobium ottawaense]|nr:hypothetical protein [Bradyrhizobium sp. CCBAU 21362]PDT64306.1 hypothetical protein CO683_39055 [Bradyrhizobium ottawaense]